MVVIVRFIVSVLLIGVLILNTAYSQAYLTFKYSTVTEISSDMVFSSTTMAILRLNDTTGQLITYSENGVKNTYPISKYERKQIGPNKWTYEFISDNKTVFISYELLLIIEDNKKRGLMYIK